MPDLFPDGQPDEARLAELRPSQLFAEEEKRRDALTAAKESGDRSKLQKAKQNLDVFRTWQRTRRDTGPAAPGVTVASPDPVNVTANQKNGA